MTNRLTHPVKALRLCGCPNGLVTRALAGGPLRIALFAFNS